MRRTRTEPISSENGDALTAFCVEHFGSIKKAALYIGAPYVSLWRNCQRPTGAWRYLNTFVLVAKKRTEDLESKLEFTREQLTHVTRLYNDLVAKIEKTQMEEI